MTTDWQIKHWKERAEKAEADLARLREARDADGEFQSEIVSDAKDPSVNVSWMRCSPDLPKYVRRLEAACAEMRESLGRVQARSWFKDMMQNEHKHVAHALSSDCGKGWLSPERKERLRAALRELVSVHERLNRPSITRLASNLLPVSVQSNARNKQLGHTENGSVRGAPGTSSGKMPSRVVPFVYGGARESNGLEPDQKAGRALAAGNSNFRPALITKPNENQASKHP